MRKHSPVLAVTLVSVASLLLPLRASAAPTNRVTNPKYGVSFYLPKTWPTPRVSTRASGSLSTGRLVLTAEDATGAADTVVEVLVGSFDNTNASEVATFIEESVAGVKILGSSVVKYRLGKAEDLRYTALANGVTVYGGADAFYLHHRSYIVLSFSSSSRAQVLARGSILTTWGT